MVLGKDWLDMVNPLIDWRSNCIYIRQGDQLHVVSSAPNVQPYRDQGSRTTPFSETVSPQHNNPRLPTFSLEDGVSYLRSWHPLSFGNTRPVSASGQLNNPRGRYIWRIQFKTRFSLTPGPARPK